MASTLGGVSVMGTGLSVPLSYQTRADESREAQDRKRAERAGPLILLVEMHNRRACIAGTWGGGRTRTGFLPRDFKSGYIRAFM